MKMKRMNRLLRKIVTATGEQRGVTLIETVIALALLGIFGVVFLSAISTSAITMASAEEKVNIDNLARAQMEYTKNSVYDAHEYGPEVLPDYTELDELDPGDPYAVTMPSGYSIDVAALAINEPDDGIQAITVTVYRNGVNLLVLEGYKANR